MISVIIPNINSNVIDQVIDALLHQTTQHILAEIIVVGQDYHQLVPCSPQVRFINTTSVLGISQARNLGAKHASGDYLLFLDADCIATEQLLEQFHARHVEGHLVVGGSIMSAFHSYWHLCDHTLIYAHFLASAMAGIRRYLPGGVLTIKRDLFEEIGAFDEDPPRIAGEDVELSFRLRRHGISLFFEPSAIVYHHHLRPSMRQVWHHLHGFGRMQSIFWFKHGFPSILRWHAGRRLWSVPIMLTAPLLSLWDILQLYQNSPTIRRHITLLPGLVWLKIAWYWGAANGILRQHTEGHHI